VVRLFSEGRGTDIATRLFVSPRTVQSHLTQVYAKLGLTSRVELVKEGARHPLNAANIRQFIGTLPRPARMAYMSRRTAWLIAIVAGLGRSSCL
jgi:hypothetical protein